MTLRILNYGADAEHASISDLDSYLGEIALSDFDAFIYDPAEFEVEFRKRIRQPIFSMTLTLEDNDKIVTRLMERREKEFRDLVAIKGGIAIILLRPKSFDLETQYWYQNSKRTARFSGYSIIENLLSQYIKPSPLWSLEEGSGDTIKLLKQNSRFFQIMGTDLQFKASIRRKRDMDPDTIIAVNGMGNAVALSLSVGRGHVLLLPVAENSDSKRIGAALVETVRQYLAVGSEEPAPAWAEAFEVPGAQELTDPIAIISTEAERLQATVRQLTADRDKLLSHRELLYSSGKFVLEPAVRRALRILKFTVKEPEEYAGEWDISMVDSQGRYYVGEVEGPEGAVDFDKLRQLLAYVLEQGKDNPDCRGVLIGNGYRSTPPEERPLQFTEHVIKNSEKHDCALVPTTELFRAVCAVLANPAPELIQEIQQSIFEARGVWAFTVKSAASAPQIQEP